jgi:hypothetical protein
MPILRPRAYWSASTARYRQRKRLAGLCIEHGCRDAAVTKAHCAAHRDIHTIKARAYRERRRLAS